ncbi:LOW QUALITY PROTEIN: SUN domain-containing ossification factor [Macrobrachium rosenbergii]|uniref:LOW QUALITY PROTEIN: SUN domain-containing ossification factor n=1 Tax=Macrobrachium rosenbergii TaxID=79674 RepID=UPI0034D5F282
MKSRVLGTVASPLSHSSYNLQRPVTSSAAAVFVVFLLCALVSRPISARSHSYDNNSVPPVGSKLEHDVVSAIKVRAHDLVANKTVDPSELIDGTKTLFTGTDRKTLSRFSDPRGFFTNVSSKSLTHDHKSSNNAANDFISRGSNSSSYDFRKIIIYPHKKRHQTDDGRDLTAEALSEGDESIKALVGGQIEDVTPEVEKSKDKNDESGADEATLEGADQDQGDTDKEKSHEKRQKKKENEESVTKLEMYLSTDDSDDEAEKEKLEKDEEIAEFKESSVAEESTSIDTKTKTKTGKEKKKSAPDNEWTVSRQKKQPSRRKQKKQLTKQKKNLRWLKFPEEELKDSKLDVGKKLDEGEGTDRKEKGKERVDEKEVETEEESKAQEEEKEKETDSDKDKVEEDQPEKPEEIASDTETCKGKKSSDSKKKDKPKSEEVEEGGVEKSEDTLETYSQFTQRVSAEKKNDATNGHGTNGHSKGSKVKGKNYASPDCGAKLVQANPEASHSSKVIHPSKDEYMLNKCRDKIWFVIELCESIRPQKFDIANFELFSNLPKDIQVFGSHRYPSRDWTSFGWFKGQEGNRGLQSFRIETEDFFKYIKVEVTSNYGSEFYCPISTFQIFGLSEFEVIDTIEDPVEDTDDENEAFTDPPEEVTKKKGKDEGKQGVIPTVLKNMFSGVLDVIKRGYRPSSSADEQGEECYSLRPKFAVENDICPMASTLNYILSCYMMEYEALMQQPFVSSTVKNSSFCRQLALTMCAEPEVNDSIVYDTVCNNSYICVMLSPKHVLAMCFMQDPQVMDKGISCEASGTLSENFSATPELLPSTETPTYVKNADINTSSITRSDAIDTNLNELYDFPSTKSSPEVIKDGKLLVEQPTDKDSAEVIVPESSVESVKSSSKEPKVNGNGAKDKIVKEGDQEATITEAEEKIEAEGSGFGGIDIVEEEIPPSPPEETPTPTSSPTTPSSVQPTELKVSNSPTNKESVVVRLSNKIKALEYNMSISSQYLEELSRRYKRQMEEMQRQFNLTIAALNDTSRQAYERDQHHQRDIEKLEEQLTNVSNILQKLVEERETLARTVVEQHVLLMVVEVIVLCMVFTICSKRRSNYRHGADYANTRRNQTPSEDPSNSGLDQDNNCFNPDSQGRIRVRRRSVDSITSERNSRLRQRRPSEEALNISGTYQDLLIIEPAIPILMDSVSDRKKKRKANSGTLKRSKSNASIMDKSAASRRAKRIEKLNVSSAGVLFCGDEVDSKTPESPPHASPGYVQNSLDMYGLMNDTMSNDDGNVFYDNMEKSSESHTRSVVSEIHYTDGVQNLGSVSKRHSFSCATCDNLPKKDRFTKSLSLCSSFEKSKSTQEKVKKIKKQKKSKTKESTTACTDTSQMQNVFPSYNNDYYYPKPNGISCCSSIEPYNGYYYNGHNSVHFSEDTNEHCGLSYSRTEDIPVNGDYSNGVDAVESDHYRHVSEFSHTNHDTQSVNEKKKLSPKVKSKVKLRSDNWEWYSSQHAGSSSSETVSTCSDSSGKGRKVRSEEHIADGEKIEERKGKRKKKSKSKASVLLEEETALEVEAGT